MLRYSLNGLKLKIFVKETETVNNSDEKSTNKKLLYPVATLTGDKAKEFYEDVIRQSSSSSSSAVSERKLRGAQKTKPKPEKLYKNSDLLKLAQNNDVKGLESFFATKCDFDVNIADDFGWTPLMCASCSGAEEAVEILLERGADVQRCDRSGNTAENLARQKNNRRIVEMLKRSENDEERGQSEGEEGEKGEDEEPFLCETCKETFSRKGTHESSTVHLFHCKMKTCTFYGIPESNRGFQLLLREGWDREKGLGKDGRGRKFPVKAVMKKDRTGIGAQPTTEKNKRDGHHTIKYESKKKRMYKKWREKNFEKNFRLEFS